VRVKVRAKVMVKEGESDGGKRVKVMVERE
jgi:hypothetical protein